MESFKEANFVVTDGATSCHDNNLWHHQCPENFDHDDTWFSVDNILGHN